MKPLIALLSILFCIQNFTYSQQQHPKAELIQALKEQGDAAYLDKKYNDALGYFQKIQSYYEEEPLVDSLFRIHIKGLADCFDALGRMEEMVLFLETWLAKQDEKKIESNSHYFFVKNLLGTYYVSTPKYKDKLSFLEKTQSSIQLNFGKKHELYGNSVNLLGSYHTMHGAYAQAEVYLKELLEIRKKGTKDYAIGLNNLALNFLYKGEFEEAEPLFLEALSIFKVLKDTGDSYAQIVSNLAGVYWKLGRYEESGTMLEEVLTIYIQSYGEDHPLSLRTLNAVAAVSQKAGNPKKAKDTYEALLKSYHRKGDSTSANYIIVLNNLGTSYNKLKEYKSAVRCFEKSDELCKKNYAVDHPEMVINHINLAGVYNALGRYNESEKLLLKALQVRTKENRERNPITTVVLNGLTSLYINWGKLDKAYDYAVRAFESNTKDFIFSKNVDSLLLQIPKADFLSLPKIINSYINLISILEKNNKEESYFKALKYATAYLLESKSKQQFDADKLAILEKTRTLSNWATAVAVKSPGKYAAEAFSITESNKAMLLADVLKARKLQSFGGLPDSLITREQDLQGQLGALKKELIDEQNPIVVRELNAQLSNTNEAIRDYHNLIKKDYPKYHRSMYYQDGFSVAALQQILDKETVLLEYLWVENKLYTYLLTADEIKVFERNINVEDLENLILKYRKSLSDYDLLVRDPELAYESYTSSATDLYAVLLEEPLKTIKDKKQLIIVPDQSLGHIPFEALLVSFAKEVNANYGELDYLVKHYKLSYSYSAALLLEGNQANVPLTKDKLELLAIAPKYKGATKAALVRSPRLRYLRDALDDLPAAKLEVEALSKIVKGRFYYGEDANEKEFKANASSYGIIHLAMHGLLDKEYPIRSALAFYENGDSTEDNFLQAYEISQMQLNAQLVVLSACETGYGKFQQGEGVMSLARSFMYAGVPSLVVSLWQVNDQSTSIIMQEFYKNLAKGMDKAAALQEAKLYYIKGVDQNVEFGLHAHPAFWAPFIQLGDSQPILVSSYSSSWGWVLGIGLGLLIMIVALVYWIQKKKD